jgi:methyl-accepting chemotaxis protein WspA
VAQVREATEEITSTASDLVTGSGLREQEVAAFGASSSEVASALQQITVTGQELTREVTRVDEMAADTVERAQGGRTQLEQMEGRMRALGAATEGVTDRLGTISERASKIGGVVTLIAKVAEQTNLLSVNAAIEAEKAGTYGRGFLVVAREIRRLADQTSAAALDIERIVRDMQSAVASGAMDLDRFGQQVRRTVTEAMELRHGVSEVIGSIERSTQSFGAVRGGMDRQASGASQISEAMGRLQVSAEASTDAARESTLAAESLHRSVRKLDTALAAFRLRS